MSFANAIWLWGLLALCIPLIIHLWSWQKTRILPFGSLRFLQESSSSQSRSIQLTDAGLMLLRMLLLLLLVLMIAQFKWNNELQKEKWLVLGDSITIPDAFNDSEYKVFERRQLTDASTYLNHWYFLQELSQNYSEIDSLIWIDNFNDSDFWGAVPPLSFNFQLINKSNGDEAQSYESDQADTIYYTFNQVGENQQLVIIKMLEANALYVNSSMVFKEVEDEVADIMFTSVFKENIPLQFVIEQEGNDDWSTSENWPYKTIYFSEDYLGDKRLYDELLLIISEQISQFRTPVWNYNDLEQTTNIRREKLDKKLVSNAFDDQNRTLFWIIILLIVFERYLFYRKRNG